jgi:hypothetical protein
MASFLNEQLPRLLLSPALNIPQYIAQKRNATLNAKTKLSAFLSSLALDVACDSSKSSLKNYSFSQAPGCWA